MILFKNNLKSIQIEGLLFLLLGISLPLKDQFSTVIMITLIAFSFVGIIKRKILHSKKHYLLICIPAILIIPRVLGLFTGEYNIAIKELVRALPLIIIPFIFITSGISNIKNNLEKFFFNGLLAGVFLFMFICEFFVIKEMIICKEPLAEIIYWRHLNFFFTEPLNAHPGYIGLLIVYLLVQILYKNYIKRNFKIIVVLFLILLLGQLMARNAIIVAGLVFILYLFKKKRLRLVLVFISSLILTFIIVFNHPSDYLRKKIIYSFDLSNTKYKDKRYERLEASFSVFKRAPFFGIGPGIDDKFRKIEYKNINDKVAYINNYNSHNQYVEYLSTYGIFGFICFATVLIYLLRLCIIKKKYNYFILLIAFMFACLTESVLERTLGIKYFSILIGFLFYNILKDEAVAKKLKK